jgi:putative membrane protein
MSRSSPRGPTVFGIDIRKWLSRLVINVAAIFVAASVVPGITLEGWKAALLAGAIFGLVNLYVKPLVRALTCPLYMFTLGLFALVVNAAMLGLTAWIAGQIGVSFSVDGFAAALVGALVTGIVSWLVALAF